MRLRVARSFLPFVVVALVGACTGYQQTQTPAVDTAAIQASVDSLGKAFGAAITARDTEGIVAFYADDAHVLPAGEPRVDGRDGIRALWVEFLSLPNLEISLMTRDVLASQAGDMATELGSYTMKWSGPKGRRMEDVGKYVTIYKRTDAGWKIVVDTWNSDTQPGM